ncbi:hypothetical protein B0T22DRAFT_447373 [Podospora appendiculata]|uniref:Uncharacterized protein n=1 Tax=Podospora appendiculata TaxID=314037 RepID=A0AAE1CFN3_9PEZI|nr:hypothetical protein B0T22DRAFT_447373 [Podospora appendiculata]
MGLRHPFPSLWVVHMEAVKIQQLTAIFSLNNNNKTGSNRPNEQKPPHPISWKYSHGKLPHNRNRPAQNSAMPQDPNLYGQRPPKKQKKEMAVTGSLSFTSQLSSLLATQSANTPSASSSSSTTANTPITGRPRPSKTKADLFSNVKVKRKATTTDPAPTKLALKTPQGTEDEKAELAHARRKMESKARLYAAMQRGDYVGREIGLVDFDRKWAEKKAKAAQNPGTSHDDDGNASSSSDDDDDSEEENNNDTELVEYEDEFGRLRRGTRADKLRFERRLARGEASAAELDRMSARPKAPENLIFGDAVQADAFAAHDAAAMEQLARKRDRSPTPPPAVHYEADREIRTKGVGFYAFSKDEDTRKAEMEGLEKERQRTEALRREREEKVLARRREIEERRREIGERRARKLADSFLDGLGADLLGGGAAGGSGDGK